jgi:S-layer homology domain.
MTNILKKQLSIIVTICFFLSIVSSVFALPSDITKHWAANVITKWMSYGIISAETDGKIKPNENITRGEFISYISKTFNYNELPDTKLIDVKKGSKYYSEIMEAYAAGIIVGDSKGNIRPNSTITRQEAAVILVKAFDLVVPTTDKASSYSDSKKISSYFRNAINSMLEGGYLSGKPGNLIAPLDKLTRAEAIKMIDNLTGNLIYKSGTYSVTNKGNVVVNTANVILKDMTIDGNLYLTQGIGNGNATLEDVTVKGKTYVKGGGENSIVLNNTSLCSLLIYKKDGKVRVVAKGDTTVEDTLLSSGAILLEDDIKEKGFTNLDIIGSIAPGQEVALNGDWENIAVDSPGLNILVKDGIIGKLDIGKNAVDTTVDISKEATVNEFIVNSPLYICGKGKVKLATINSNSVRMQYAAERIITSLGITPPEIEMENLADESIVAGDSLIPPTGGGPTGGGLVGGGPTGGSNDGTVGTEKDTTLPTILTAVSTSNTTVEVKFSEDLDPVSATNKANYSIAGLEITSASVNGDTVTLRTISQSAGRIYKVVATNVTDKAGNVVDSSHNSIVFAGRAAGSNVPVVKKIVSINGNTINVTFTVNTMLSDTAINKENYSIDNGLSIISAELPEGGGYSSSPTEGNSQTVILKTSEQTVGQIYHLTVSNIADLTGKVIAPDSYSFYGTALDTTGIGIDSVVAETNTSVKVTLNDEIDETTAVPDNFKIGGLIISSVHVSYYDAKIINLTTSAQIADNEYNLMIKNLKDLSGNGVDTAHATAAFKGIVKEPVKVQLSGAVAINNTTLKLYFNQALDKTSAENESNYTIITPYSSKSNIGSTTGELLSEKAKGQAILDSVNGDTVTITFGPSFKMVSGELYTIKVESVTGKAGTVLDTAQNSLQFAGNGTERKNLSVVSVVALDSDTIKITFNQNINSPTVDESRIELYKNKGDIGLSPADSVGQSSVDNIDGANLILNVLPILSSNTIYYVNILPGSGIMDESLTYDLSYNNSVAESEWTFATGSDTH